MSKTYTVWKDGDDPAVESDRYHSPSQVYDAAGAAKKFAANCYAHLDAAAWDWPVAFMVRDETTKRITKYVVELHLVPEFRCASGELVCPRCGVPCEPPGICQSCAAE